VNFLPLSPRAPPREQWRASVDFIIRARGGRVSGDRNFSAVERSSGFNFNCGASCYLRASFASSLSLFVSPFLCHLICPLKSARARIPGCRIFIEIPPTRAAAFPHPSPLAPLHSRDDDRLEIGSARATRSLLEGREIADKRHPVTNDRVSATSEIFHAPPSPLGKSHYVF